MKFIEYSIGLDYKVFKFDNFTIRSGRFVLICHLPVIINNSGSTEIIDSNAFKCAINELINSDAVVSVIAYNNVLIIHKNSESEWVRVMIHFACLLPYIHYLSYGIVENCLCEYCGSEFNKSVLINEQCT